MNARRPTYWGGELEKVYNPRTNPWGLSKEKLEWYANRGVTFGY